MAEELPNNPYHKRKMTVLEKIGVGATVVSSFAMVGAMKNHFWTREEGDAVQSALAEVKTQIAASNAEQTRVVERKVDKILEFMKEDRAEARGSSDRLERRIENIELIVLTKPTPKKGSK